MHVRRRRLPECPGRSASIPVLEQPLHIDRIEADRCCLRIVRVDRCEVELPVPTLGELVGRKQSIARVGANRGLERARDDEHRRGRHRLEIRRKLAVHDDVDFRAGVRREQRRPRHQHRLRHDEHVRRHAAVDVHLGETLSFRFDVDEHRREHARDARRRGENIAEQIERARLAAGGDLAHVPDRGALRVEIRRHDIEAAARPVLARDRRRAGRHRHVARSGLAAARS